MLRTLAQRHPCALAIVLFIAAMTVIKLGATQIVDSYGLPGTLLAIAAIFGFVKLMDWR